MRRHLAQPLDAGVLHGHVGVEALGDGVGDHRLPLLLQQLDEPPLLLDQRVDLPGLVVQEGGNILLFITGRQRYLSR